MPSGPKSVYVILKLTDMQSLSGQGGMRQKEMEIRMWKQGNSDIQNADTSIIFKTARNQCHENE